MGAYINYIRGRHIGIMFVEKILHLMGAGATPIIDSNSDFIQAPEEFQENMVCVVDNGHFAAAGYAYDEREFKTFLPTKTDDRQRAWFIYKDVKDCAEPKMWEDEAQ